MKSVFEFGLFHLLCIDKWFKKNEIKKVQTSKTSRIIPSDSNSHTCIQGHPINGDHEEGHRSPQMTIQQRVHVEISQD